MTKTELRNLLADGKTDQVLTELRNLSAYDSDLHNEVLQISAQFATNDRQWRLNTADPKDVKIEQNRINSVIIMIIDILPDDLFRKKVNPIWGKIALWLGILAVAAVFFTGYTIKDWLSEKEKPLRENPQDTSKRAQNHPTDTIGRKHQKVKPPKIVSQDTSKSIIPPTTTKTDTISKGNPRGTDETKKHIEDPTSYQSYTARFMDEKNVGIEGVKFNCQDCDPIDGISNKDGWFTIKRNIHPNNGAFSELYAYKGAKDTTVKVYWFQPIKNIKFYQK